MEGELYRHCHTCACKYEEKQHSPVSDGILLLDGAINAKIPQKLNAQVIARMRRDSVTETVKNDDLILMLGSSLEEDLTTLKAYLLAQMSQLSDQLAGQPTAADWRRLAELTLTRVIVFNGRRGNEAAQLLVSEYELRTNNVQCSLMCSTV